MNININSSLLSLATIALLSLSGCGNADGSTVVSDGVSDSVITAQREALGNDLESKNNAGTTVGPQSPRDIDSITGDNDEGKALAPVSTMMNLCDIHFHKSAEHKGGQFTTYAGNGNGKGYGSGYKYNGTLTADELASYTIADAHNPLYSGDTIEVHYVYTTNPGNRIGNGLGTCLAGGENPQLRVEAQVYVLVNDEHEGNFTEINHVTKVNGLNQVEHIPHSSHAVQYKGSTTGPGYNEEISPYHVTWNVRPEVVKVNIETVEEWLHHNNFEEHHAHAVRNLVTNSALLSDIPQP